jgi:hypothetical protein
METMPVPIVAMATSEIKALRNMIVLLLRAGAQKLASLAVYRRGISLCTVTNASRSHRFPNPAIEAFARISSSLDKYCAARAQKARVAKHAKMLAEFDMHMLNDIGLKGFNGLGAEEQENLLLNTIQSGA